MTGNTTEQPVSPYGHTRWDRLLYWSNRFDESEGFDGIKRDYKRKVVKRIQEAKTALSEDDLSWIDKLNGAITAPPNNLMNWRATQPFIAWCRGDLESAALAFRFLWNANAEVAERFDRFGDIVATSGRNILIAEASCFHMAMDPAAFPMFRSVPVDRAWNSPVTHHSRTRVSNPMNLGVTTNTSCGSLTT